MIDFVKDILESFDYTLIAGNDSKIEKLIVQNADDYQTISPDQASGKLPDIIPIINETGPVANRNTLYLELTYRSFNL